jgi:hypothetical protein
MTDFERNFSAWLARVCREERPPSSVVAYNLGLCETPDGYSAYLIGADRYDAEDSDWACSESFTPSERYFPIPAAEFGSWEQVQKEVVAAVRAFVQSPEGQRSFLAAAEAVTVGFDDGDLERVR